MAIQDVYVAYCASPAAVSPIVPAARTSNCGVTSHSAAGVYEITLDQAIPVAECVETICVRGAAVDADYHVEHVSDTVKRIRTNVAGVASDTLGFTAKFERIPAGH